MPILVLPLMGILIAAFSLTKRGSLLDGEYIVGLLADVFLDKVPDASIVHDPRIIWNTQSVVAAKGGTAVRSKIGSRVHQTNHARGGCSIRW